MKKIEIPVSCPHCGHLHIVCPNLAPEIVQCKGGCSEHFVINTSWETSQENASVTCKAQIGLIAFSDSPESLLHTLIPISMSAPKGYDLSVCYYGELDFISVRCDWVDVGNSADSHTQDKEVFRHTIHLDDKKNIVAELQAAINAIFNLTSFPDGPQRVIEGEESATLLESKG